MQDKVVAIQYRAGLKRILPVLMEHPWQKKSLNPSELKNATEGSPLRSAARFARAALLNGEAMVAFLSSLGSRLFFCQGCSINTRKIRLTPARYYIRFPIIRILGGGGIFAGKILE